MTIKLPSQGLPDSVLALFGKRRGLVVTPSGKMKYGTVRAHWESFWVVLFRSAKAPLPDGVLDPEVLKDEDLDQ